MKAAMKSGDKEKLSTLRMLISAVQYEEVARDKPLEQSDYLTILAREVKKRNEAAEAYRTGGREENALKEEREAVILKAYLPQQMSEAEIREAIQAVIAEKGLTAEKAQLGLLMKEMMARFKGKVDGKMVQVLAGEYLN
jgi:uncharacterized protein YqeY